jgi:hypothetical protein
VADGGWNPGGRTLAWRAGAAAAGLVAAGAAVVLVLWPHLLAWAVAAALGAVGVLLVLSALLARGRD